MMIRINEDTPLMGCIAFGIIDRGTNLLQVRATSMCNLNCVFCSTDSGPFSQYHKNNFIVDLNYLIRETKKIVEFKGVDVEINIDSVGEPLTYPEIVKLVRRCKNIDGVVKVSMQTNGVLLDSKKIKELKKAGLDVVNLSISSLDASLAKELSGFSKYSVKKIKDVARELVENGIVARLCPVWVPKKNDEQMVQIIKFAKEIGAELGLQKYEIYKYSRKVGKVRPLNWWKFYDQLKKWEKEYKIKLVLGRQDIGIKKAKRVPEVFKKNEKVQLEVKLPGWFKDQMICIGKNRCVSVLKCDRPVGDVINVKILETNNNLYVGEMI